MSTPISSVLITPAEAAALTRASQIEELATRSAEGAAPAGEASFAAALEAASATQGAPQGAPTEAGAAPEPMPDDSPDPMPSAEAEPVGGTAASLLAEQALGYPGPATASGGAPATSPAPLTTSGGAPATSLAPATTSAAAGEGAYESLIQQAAARNGIDPAILHGLIEQESGFDPNAHSSAGALGLTQLMPSTAASLGVTEPLDPTQSIEGGARLLGELMRQFGGNLSDALAAYNAGAGAVQKYGGVPPYPETEAYVAKVLANAQSHGQAL